MLILIKNDNFSSYKLEIKFIELSNYNRECLSDTSISVGFFK